MTNAQKIKIDDVEYAIADLSDEAKGQLTNLRVTDQEIARLQTQLAIAQTARAAYAQVLASALPKGDAKTVEPKKDDAKKAPAKKG